MISYAAAVLGRAAGEVFSIERHPLLAELARQRNGDFGYDNVKTICGDGMPVMPNATTESCIMLTANHGTCETATCLKPSMQ